MPVSGARVKVACKLCNSRRVRCDRTESTACSNCRSAGHHCEPIQSRRGKHPKHKKDRPNATSISRSRPSQTNERNSHQPADSLRQSTSCRSSQAAPDAWDGASSPGRTLQRDLNHSSFNGSGGNGEQSRQENGSNPVVYMGDSSNINYFMVQVGNPFQTSSRPSSRGRFWGECLQRFFFERLDQQSKQLIDQAWSDDCEHLRGLGALQMPQKETSDSLLKTFFLYSQPVFPIFDLLDFSSLYGAGRASPLLLNAIFLVAVMHCPESTLAAAGFTSRYIACLTFYRRVKALYDANYECDAISTIQATLLISHWWGSPLEQKDTWHWLGVAAGLAQSLGMHQSKSYSSLQPRYRRLWRRIWWTLYVQDIHMATVLNRPPHISSSFLDVGPLDETDFCDTEVTGTDIFPNLSRESRLFIIHFAELISKVNVCLTEKLMASGNSPHGQPIDEDWHLTLPPELRDLPSRISMDHGFWGSILQISHCNYQIVFRRQTSESPGSTGVGTVPFNAAAKTTRLIEDLLSSGTLYLAPRHIVSGIFASLVIHIINIRKGDDYIKMISEHWANLSMTVLSKFEELWPIVVWTRRLFECILKPPSAEATSNAAGSNLGYYQQTIDESRIPQMLSPDSMAEHHVGRTRHAAQERDLADAASSGIGTSFFPCHQNEDFSSLFTSFPFGSLLEDAGFSPVTGLAYLDTTMAQPPPDMSQLP
ncbi:transcription factor [Coccidioides immitis RS]|uniref:Transcription factor n=2 Tax=Coccidioides immitis TaxID=5501 RepID=A0A0E1RXT9_COCIM|nr:transcription factor [Coccidioides immitis RS]EAS31580.2 transcription factor [Coccidioides immitis RS]KMU87046.1 cutinase transcription factor 1 alpha [Coccidioides immitis H538.4]TPX24333.1 hypothetical protein DIZ76_013679 [Coccidioides immitis]